MLGSDAMKKVAVLGLTFKPDTDDMRDAPSREIIRELHKGGYPITVYDPIAMEHAKALFKDIPLTYAKDAYDAVEGADLMILVTEWNEFRELDLKRVKTLMKSPNVIDGRNIYEPEVLKALGFTYVGVGR